MLYVMIGVLYFSKAPANKAIALMPQTRVKQLLNVCCNGNSLSKTSLACCLPARPAPDLRYADSNHDTTHGVTWEASRC
jgi:hypothetical protein